MLGFLPSQPSVWNIRRRKRPAAHCRKRQTRFFFLFFLLKAADEMNTRTYGLEFAHRAHFLDERQISITDTLLWFDYYLRAGELFVRFD